MLALFCIIPNANPLWHSTNASPSCSTAKKPWDLKGDQWCWTHLEYSVDFSLLETSAGLNNSMIFLSQETPSSMGWEHEGAIFNRLLLSLFKGQRTLIPEQACLLSVTLNKCSGVQEAPVLNILSPYCQDGPMRKWTWKASRTSMA